MGKYDALAISRMLWIIPSDLFVISNATDIGRQLQECFNCEIWLLLNGTSLAFSPRGVLVNQGRPLDCPAFREASRPLFEFLKLCIEPDYSVTDLEIPDGRFWPRILLSRGESDSRYCRYFKRSLVTSDSFAFNAYASCRLTPPKRGELKTYIEAWVARHSSEAFHGDRLDLGELTITDYFQESTEWLYEEDGFKVCCSKYSPVTWPWLSFYLEMRQTFPKKHRLSISFFDST